MQNEQKFGRKTFYFYLFQNTALGFFLLFVSLVLFGILDQAAQLVATLGATTESANSLVSLSTFALFILSLFSIAAGVAMSWLKYVSSTFTFDQFDFRIKRGILDKKEMSIPYHHIENIEIEQALIPQLVGVCRAEILTSGSDAGDKELMAESIFQMMDMKVAQDMKIELLKRAGVMEIKEEKVNDRSQNLNQ